MNISKMLFICAVLVNASYVFTMDDERSRQHYSTALSEKIYITSDTRRVYPPTYRNLLINKDVLPTCEKNIQYNAYAAAIHRNSDDALEKLEACHVPIPDTNDLTFMMEYYGLPIREYSLKNGTKILVPQEPKLKAIIWCLKHGANPNGSYQTISYTPFAKPYPEEGRPHPLKHIAAASYSKERLDALQLLKERGAFLDADKSSECAELIGYLLNNPLCFLAHNDIADDIDDGFIDDGDIVALDNLPAFFHFRSFISYQKAERISEVLTLYDGAIVDGATTQAIKELIAQNSRFSSDAANKVYARELKEHLKTHTSEGIAAQERARQRAAFWKSLFSCGRSAEQSVIPLKK